MNGAADLGGMMGFGPVDAGPDHDYAGWEWHALALTLAVGAIGRWSIDAGRHARESLHPAAYLTLSYYEIWVTALERMLVTAGLVTADEIAQGRAFTPGAAVRVLGAADVAGALATRRPYDRPVAEPARFGIGDAVRTRVMHPAGHTRLPRYARGKVGVVERVHGAHVLPDANAHGTGEQPQWLYSVRFDGRELWGAEADATLTVAIDAWEGYLDPV